MLCNTNRFPLKSVLIFSKNLLRNLSSSSKSFLPLSRIALLQAYRLFRKEVSALIDLNGERCNYNVSGVLQLTDDTDE